MSVLRVSVSLALTMLAFQTAFAARPSTRNNDDTCDISVTPAATLLLPYFEVDLGDPEKASALFTITNVGAAPQIARATIWTDYSYPVLTFNVFLTGYDIATIHLYDVLANGRVGAQSSATDTEVGQRSAPNDSNELLDLSECTNIAKRIPPATLADVRSALTTGRVSACGTAAVGSSHANAIGYVTIDLVGNCNATMPIEESYFTNDIRYDNVLVGDYQQLSHAHDFAEGNPLVHIRAIPEGGLPGSANTNFYRTFYSRFQDGGTGDRRQPLPSTFAARWINGGTGQFRGAVKVWHEPVTGRSAGCAVASNASVKQLDIVRFDEDENATTWHSDLLILAPEPTFPIPSTRRLDMSDAGILPPPIDNNRAGWLYLNIGIDNRTLLPASQGWVTVSMEAEGRYAVDFDAAMMGNGCTARFPITDEEGGPPVIEPGSNETPDYGARP